MAAALPRRARANVRGRRRKTTSNGSSELRKGAIRAHDDSDGSGGMNVVQRRHGGECASPTVPTWTRRLMDASRSAAAVAASVALATATAGTAPSALAGEFDILNTPTPTQGSYVVDDAKVLSKASEGALRKSLTDLETETGFHIDVVTTRKLTFAADAYEFADKTIEKWYPTKELGDKKGLVLVVTAGKEGAVVGGPAFVKTAGVTGDSIAGESIPFYGDKDAWNEAVLSSVKRLDAVIRGGEDPGPPKVNTGKAGRSYKTKEETDAKKVNFSTAVIGLLVISFVAPMAQYFAYTKSDD